MKLKSDRSFSSPGQKITEVIELISENTDKLELLEMLDPVFQDLSTMNEAQTEACLRYVIKPRFKLTEREVNSYRKIIDGHRNGNSGRGQQLSDKRDKNISYTAYFEGLVDLVEDKGKTAFLIKDGNDLEVRSQVEIDGVEYLPPPRDKIPWLLCEGQEIVKLHNAQRSISDKEINAQLYGDLWAYHAEISELPDVRYYDLLTAWDFHTYLTESVQYSPIICLYAIPERGKSRTGKGMIYVAYRGVHIESLREAHILRIAHNLKSSIFFDIRDVWKKALKENSDDLLLSRFEKGLQVARVLFPERGPHKDIVYFKVFGPTVIATNQAVDKILDTRAITINMQEANRNFEDDLEPGNGLELKVRLTVFRARQLDKPLPQIAKPTKARLGDIMRPMGQIIQLVQPERMEAFMEMVNELAEKRRIDKVDSLEAKILSAIVGLECKVNRGILPVKQITEKINEGTLERFQLSPQRIGRELSAMGFNKAKTDTGCSAIILDQDYIERLKESYGLPQTSETSERSGT